MTLGIKLPKATPSATGFPTKGPPVPTEGNDGLAAVCIAHYAVRARGLERRPSPAAEGSRRGRRYIRWRSGRTHGGAHVVEPRADDGGPTRYTRPAMSHLAKRQNPLRGAASDETAERWLGRVAEHFGSGWLGRDGGNPVQALWKRRDALASSELLTLGSALDALAPHTKWLAAQVRLAKGLDRNNAQGALFEILALGQLGSTDAAIEPAKASQAGFDGTLRFRSSGRLVLSLKRYGTSKHQAEVNRRAHALRAELFSTLSKMGWPELTVMAWADAYPEAADWKLLGEALADPRRFRRGENAVGLWHVLIGSLPKEDGVIAAAPPSHVLQVVVPYHRNEADNLRDKMLDGCRNLAKHGVDENDLSSNAIYIHLPPSASIIACEQWAKQWFADFPTKPVSAVLLYQPTVARREGGESVLHHCFRLVRRGGGSLLPGNVRAVPNIMVPIGVHGTEPSAEQIVATDGRRAVLADHYVYQRGDIYREMIPDGKGGWTGTLTSPAPGVHVHGLLPRELGGTSRHVLNPIFARSDELLVL